MGRHSVMREPGTKSVLFYRSFRGFTGGHLKVWHYFNHVKASAVYTPRIYITERSIWDDSNPWWQSGEAAIAKTWAPADADVLFIGGMDWRALPAKLLQAERTPIINIVQHLSHTDPQDPKYEFLQHKAIRICVNPLLEKALLEVPGLNGPLIHIPMGLDLHNIPQAGPERYDVVIAAMKAPQLGAKIKARLQNRTRRIELLTKKMPRAEYLGKVASSRVAVLLPLPTEGFYLPMLEAMAMRRVVVCPDCVANRAYCIPGRNGFLPDYAAEAIEIAVESALALPQLEAQAMRDNAAETAAAYTMERERDAFLNVLTNLDDLWRR